jgi:hypothetical protein
MKKLTVSIDARNRELQTVYGTSDYVNYYATPSGTDAVEIPAGASYVELCSLGQDVWFKLGKDDVTAAAPSADVEDGSASNYVASSQTNIYRITGETHLALASSGDVVVSYWSQ